MDHEIVLPDGGLSRRLSARALVIGRAPECDLVLADEAVSSRHVELWTDGEGVWLRDLGSRNGVRVDGETVHGTLRLRVGADVLVGRTRLRVQVANPGGAVLLGPLVVEDVASGHGAAFLGERMRLGADPDAHLCVPGADEVVLVRVSNDEILLGRDDDMTPLPLGRPFDVGGRRFVVRPAPERQPTADLPIPHGRYRIAATLAPAPRAEVVDIDRGRAFVVAAENRATLLWVLAHRWADDRSTGAAEAGWVPESEVMTAVWGRAPGATAANLRVLVCRLRRDLREAGLDPWFLEQRAGHLRAKVAEVELGG